MVLLLLLLIYLCLTFLTNKFVGKENYFYPLFAFIRDFPLKIFNFLLALIAVGTAMSIPIGIIGLIGRFFGEKSISWVMECKIIIYPAMLIVVIFALVLANSDDFGIPTRDNDLDT